MSFEIHLLAYEVSRLEKWLEQVRPVLIINAYSIILDLERQHFLVYLLSRFHFYRYGYLTLREAEL